MAQLEEYAEDDAGRASSEPLSALARAVVWRPGALRALIERAREDEAAYAALLEFCRARDDVLRTLSPPPPAPG